MSTPPLLTYSGRRFTGDPTDYEDLSGKLGTKAVGGPVSIGFTACWESLQSSGILLEGGSFAGGVHISIFSHSATITLHVQTGSAGVHLEVVDAIVPGEISRFLSNVTADGQVRLFKNGEIIGERVDGHACEALEFLYVARSHQSKDAYPFQGTLEDLVLWNAEVSWSEMLEQSAFGESVTEDAATLCGAAPPLIRYEGRSFSGSTSDFEDLGLIFGSTAFGGPVSIGFTACWETFEPWSRIIDFGNGPENCNIFIANRGPTGTLNFNIWVGNFEFRCEARNAIIVKETHRYLCSVTASGHMQIFCDGTMVGENQKGAAPTFAVRRCLYVGRSNWNRDKPFNGSVRDLALWNETLSWDEFVQRDGQVACSREPPAQQPFVTAYGTKEPVVVYEGRQFAGHATDFADLGYRYRDVVFGSELSVAFWARWDGLQPWSRIIDFGDGPDSNNFFIATHGMTRDLAFHVWAGPYEARIRVPEAIIPGKTNRYLCTVSASGHMRVWRDGKLLHEEFRGAPPSYGTRRFLYVGRSNWDRDRPFSGMIMDLSVWNAVVSWEESKAPNLQKQWEDHRHEWECQGIVRKEDGMWCTWCEKGPMTSATVVQRHLESKGHLKETEKRGGPPVNTPAGKLELQKVWASHKLKWQRQGIEKKDDGFWCIWCEKGPITSAKLVDQHIEGKAHQKLYEQVEMKKQWEEHQQEWESQGLELREDGMWCTYCDKGPMVSGRMVEQHIDGRVHQKTMEQRDLNKEWERHRKEWEPQSIVYKEDSFWCICCDKGPMTSASVVQRHVETKGHQNKATASHPLQLPDTYLCQGITADDNQPNPPIIAYKCKFCDAGPFTALVVIDAHLQSKKHKKAMERKRTLDPGTARPLKVSEESGGQIRDKENCYPANKHADDDDEQGLPTSRIKWGGCESIEIEELSSSDESDDIGQGQRFGDEKASSQAEPPEVAKIRNAPFESEKAPIGVECNKAHTSDKPVEKACSPEEPIESERVPSFVEFSKLEILENHQAINAEELVENVKGSSTHSQVAWEAAPSIERAANPEEFVQIEKAPGREEPVEIEKTLNPEEPVEIEEASRPGGPVENSSKAQGVHADSAGVRETLEASGMATITHLCVGSVVRALEDTAPIESGYLALLGGEAVKVLYLGTKANSDEGWLYGLAISTGQQGWLSATAVDIHNGAQALGSAADVPAAPSITVGSEVFASADVASIGSGYLALMTGEKVKVLHIGSQVTQDDGWMYGHSQTTDQQGWFSAATVVSGVL